MKYTFDFFSSQNQFLMIPMVILDFLNVVRGYTNRFWYHNDDLGLVGMSICAKKVSLSVKINIPV